MSHVLVAILILGTVAAAAAPVHAQADRLTESPDGPEAVRVYFTEDEALAKVFGKAERGARHTWIPTDDQRAALERQLGVAVTEESFAAWRGRDGDRDLGWALVLEEKGRFKPITFMVHVRPGGQVGFVLVMVYRESRGDGVKRQRFLKQFRGKDLDDSLRLNRDVVGLTGATLSSRAITHGVRKALVLAETFGGEAP